MGFACSLDASIGLQGVQDGNSWTQRLHLGRWGGRIQILIDKVVRVGDTLYAMWELERSCGISGKIARYRNRNLCVAIPQSGVEESHGKELVRG